MNQLIVFLLLIGFIIFIPVGALIHVIAPKSKVNYSYQQLLLIICIIIKFLSLLFLKIGRFMCLPCIKFITFTISYITFIVLLVLSSLRIVQRDLDEGLFSHHYNESYEKYQIYMKKELKYKFPTNDFHIRTTQPNNVDLAICVWLLGSKIH